ncbi:hypothetical protein UT300007_21150 [Clostridium sp. CTA-7]
MKITIDDQYHSDENNNYEEDQYAVDESGNLNLFINVDGEFGDEEPVETINKDNICNKEEEKKIIESNFSENIWHDEKYSERYSDIYSEIENDSDIGFKSYNQVEEKGTIEVISKLASKDGVDLKGARINLYLLNGVSPKLYDSKITDEKGKVRFDSLENGCYRVISIIDRRFFEKPAYYTWNEVTIDKNNKFSSICVINRIKMAYYRR